MRYEVKATAIAVRQIAELRGARRRAYERFEQDLARQGCKALSYRLTGGPLLASFCVKHLYGTDRALVAFSDDKAMVLLVGPHAAGDAAADVYSILYELAGVPPPSQARKKPPCCQDSGSPPTIDEIATDELFQRGRALRQ